MRRLALPVTALATVLAFASAAFAVTPKKVLFDNTHQETAGNADWQIDTDQPVPLPDQSGITQATTESYWYGAISAWGVAMVKKGYTVHTLTTSYGITYGSPTNPYDLSKYDLFIVDEPNTAFTRAESTAIFNYLRDGGGMFAVCDHAGSDRNSDGVDSPKAWGRLDQLHLLGAHFDSTGEGSSSTNNFTQNSGNIDTTPGDSIIFGPVGYADSISFHNGTSMHLYPATNPSVKGAIWQNGLSHGTSGVMVAYASYGKGRVVFVGDSSPCDDGSAVSGNSSIYNGWAEATGRDSLVFMNGSLWATRTSDTTPPAVTVTAPNGGESVVQGTVLPITWTASDDGGVIDSVKVEYSLHGSAGPWVTLSHGVANSGSYAWTTPLVVSDSVMARVTAYDPLLNAGSDVSNALAHITLPPDTTPPAVQVLAPNGGESVLQGSDLGVSWTATDANGVVSVDLDYSLHGAAGPWVAIAHGIANSGSATWTTPLEASDSVLVRVTAVDPSNNGGSDVSDAFAAITAPVGIVSPPAGRPFAVHVASNSSRAAVRFLVDAPSSGVAHLEVHDVLGRLVWRTTQSVQAGRSEIAWGGRTVAGGAAPSGVLTVRCTTAWGTSTARVVRLAP